MAWTNSLSHQKKTFVHSLLTSMSLNGILQLILVVSALAERCTIAVPVQKYPAKKMHVLRRVPASCSNWDKAWSWITNVDCGTKYRLDYITVPPREVVQYKLDYVCCDGSEDCDESEDVHSSTFDSTDEKFLAIILGSTAAAVIIIIIVVAISLCTRRRRCASSGRERGHAYDRAEAEDYHKGDATVEKLCRAEDATSDTECVKPCEPVYAEIGEETLPRYTDLFHDENSSSGQHDPFVHATAPSYYTASGKPKENPTGDKRNSSNNTPTPTEKKKQLAHYTNTSNVSISSVQCKAISPTTIHEESESYAVVSRQTRPNTNSDSNSIQVKSGSGSGGGGGSGVTTTTSCATDSSGTKYYNVGEKKKKKKKKANGQTTKDRENRRRSKTSVSGDGAGVEMMVKSTSASETVCSSRRTSAATDVETTLNKQQKRRSAPPDSIEIGINSVHPYTQPIPKSSSMSGGRDKNSTKCNNTNSGDVISVCTIHEKPCPSPLSPHQGITPSQSSSLSPSSNNKQQQNVLRKSPSAVLNGEYQLRTSSDCSSSIKPRHKSCSSYENIPRSTSQPNSIIPHSASNSASLDRIHGRIPNSRSMQQHHQTHSSSLSSRDKNTGSKSRSKDAATSKTSKSSSQSQKRCSNSNSSLRGKDCTNYDLQHHSNVVVGDARSMPRDVTTRTSGGYSLATPINSGGAVEFHPTIKSNDHSKPKSPSYENNGAISRPPPPSSSSSSSSTTKSSSQKLENHRREVTSPTYDTLQYSRDSSPDRVYQKLLAENNPGVEGNSWKV